MSIVEYGLVFILTLLAGGWSIPAGILFGLNPVGVYIAASLGSVLWTLAAMTLGGRLRDRAMARFVPDAAERVASSKAGVIVARWGIVGLATVGSVVLGPTLTILAALVFGVERKRFLSWYVASTLVGFALLTAFWVAVT